jgi:hypothetical protein
MVVVKTAVATGLLAQAKELVVHHVLHSETVTIAHLALGVLAMTVQLAMIAHRVATVQATVATTVLHAVMTNVSHVLSATAKTVQHVQVLVVASATATVQSVLHTASQILHVSKTALQSAVGQKTVAAKSATQTVQTVQHAMIHANQLSAAHATQTQTRRLSSKTRFLSV